MFCIILEQHPHSRSVFRLVTILSSFYVKYQKHYHLILAKKTDFTSIFRFGGSIGLHNDVQLPVSRLKKRCIRAENCCGCSERVSQSCDGHTGLPHILCSLRKKKKKKQPSYVLVSNKKVYNRRNTDKSKHQVKSSLVIQKSIE